MIAIFNFSDYNLTRTVSACVAAQQQTSVSFNYEKAEKYCEEKNQNFNIPAGSWEFKFPIS